MQERRGCEAGTKEDNVEERRGCEAGTKEENVKEG